MYWYYHIGLVCYKVKDITYIEEYFISFMEVYLLGFMTEYLLGFMREHLLGLCDEFVSQPM